MLKGFFYGSLNWFICFSFLWNDKTTSNHSNESQWVGNGRQTGRHLIFSFFKLEVPALQVDPGCWYILNHLVVTEFKIFIWNKEKQYIIRLLDLMYVAKHNIVRTQKTNWCHLASFLYQVLHTLFWISIYIKRWWDANSIFKVL